MINFGSDAEFIANYQKLKSSRKMGVLYGCDKKTITTHARKIGYDYSQNKERKITHIPIEEVIQQYQKLKSCDKVGAIYECSGTTVRNYLLNNGYIFDTAQKIDAKTYEQLCLDGYTLKEISSYFQCSEVTVRNFIHKHHPQVLPFGLAQDASGKLYTPGKLSLKDKEFILENYEKMSSTELAQRFQVSRGMITKLWYDNNLSNKQIVNTKTTERDMIGKVFGYWKVLSRSDKRNSGGCIYYNCICEYNDCGIQKEVLGTSLRQGLSLTCGAHTNVSKGNEAIKLLLQKANIPFEIEKRFLSCIDKTYLPFDFFVNNSYLIEFDGLQHFEEGIFDYEYTHKHDLIKNQWCKEHHIPLIRIPYTHLKKLKLQDLLLETTTFLVQDYADNKSDKIGEIHQDDMDNPEVTNQIAKG